MTKTIEFIAEAGSNWYVPGVNGLERAKKLVETAARHGANGIKFQLLKADKLYRKEEKIASLKKLELPVEWIPELYDTCSAHGIEFLCTPFYLEAVNILNPFVNRYKIASWDLTYTPLLKAISKTGKPVILSTGAATMEEVEQALVTLRPDPEHLCDDVTILHCTGGYPTNPNDMILNRILDLATDFYPAHVGLSSHCKDPHVTASAVMYGAEIIEVHFDLADKLGAEAGHSYSPKEFAEMVALAKKLGSAMDCGCERTLVDAVARNSYYRDESDWLRPVLKPE